MRRSRKQLLGTVLWIVSAVATVAVTITPVAGMVDEGTPERFCLVCGELGVVDAAWNVVMFIPLGVGLAMSGVRASRAALAMLAGTVIIELLQVTAVAGRDASLGDIVWNSLGGVIGWSIGRKFDVLLYPRQRSSLVLTICSLTVWLGACVLVPWALQGHPTDADYVGQLGRALGGLLPYPGHVLAATVSGLTIPNDVIQHSSDVRRALLHPQGAYIEARVVPGKPTDWDASLVRIVDPGRREILELSALGNDLLFAFRTHAAPLRLRTMRFRLARAFGETQRVARAERADTVLIAARYAEDLVELRSTSGGVTVQTRIPLTASSGWRLLSPLPIDTDGSLRDALLNAGWLFVLVTAGSYWLSFVASLRRRRMMQAVALVTLVAGLAVGPYAFRVAPPSLADVSGVAAGVAAGSLLATFVRRRRTTAGAESSE